MRVLLVLYFLTGLAQAKPAPPLSSLPPSEAKKLWTQFNEIEPGYAYQASDQRELKKYRLVDKRGQTWNLLVVCEGACENFRCGKKGEPFQLGCVESAQCFRREFVSHSKTKWLWSALTRQEMRL